MRAFPILRETKMPNKTWYAMAQKGAGNAEIMIYDEIGAWGISAKQFAADLKGLGTVRNIDLRINSPGGSVFDGMAIYNLIKQHEAQVTVYVDGLAASMASVIAMAGDIVVAPANSLMMVHNPWTLAIGDAKELRDNADLLDKIRTAMVSAYTSKTGLGEEEIILLMDEETWLTGEEAVEKGFADVLEGSVDMAACINKITSDFPTLSAVADFTRKQEGIMPNANQATSQVDIENAKAEAVKAAMAAEESRKNAIVAAFGDFAQAHGELLNKCLLDSKVTVDDARARLLQDLGNGHAPHGGAVHVEATGAKAKFKAMAAALDRKAGFKSEESVGREFFSATLFDMAKACLVAHQFDLGWMNKGKIVQAALSHSSSDFPKLLENVGNKTLLAAYAKHTFNWDKVARRSSVSDFKEVTRIRMGSFNNLEVIPEGGEYKYGTFGEESEKIKAQTKGRALSLTRQMIINDDLGGFLMLAEMLGRAASRTVNADVFKTITSNPTMADGYALFSSQHKNLASGAGSVITAASVDEGRSAMRMHKDLNGHDYLDIQPAILLVPVALQSTASQLMRSETDPSKTNSKVPNPVAGAAEVVSSPYLDEASTNDWYLIANPSDLALIEVAFLDGVSEPYLDTHEGFDIDGVKWKVRLDYGVAAMDYKGGWKNGGGS